MIFIYICTLVFGMAFYFLYSGPVSFYLIAFLLLFPIFSGTLLWIAKRKTTISLSQKSLVFFKEKNCPFIIMIENESNIPIPTAKVVLEYTNVLTSEKSIVKILTPIYPKNKQYLRMGISSEHYGTVRVRLLKIRCFDILRLFRFKLPDSACLINQCEVTFIPNYISMDNEITNYADFGLESDTFSKTKHGDDPSEIFDIHEYVEGDRISRIHWKLSAKLDNTFIKEFSLPVSNSFVIGANIFGSGNEILNGLDTVIECVSAITSFLTESEVPHTLCWYDSDNERFIKEESEEFEKDSLLIREILRSPSAKNNHSCAYCLSSEMTEATKYAHFIYATTCVDDNILKFLMESNLAYKYTILLADNSIKTYSFDSSNINIINVEHGRIAKCLSDLVL